MVLRTLCCDGRRGCFTGDMALGALAWRQWPGERLGVRSMSVPGMGLSCARACAISVAEARFLCEGGLGVEDSEKERGLGDGKELRHLGRGNEPWERTRRGCSEMLALRRCGCERGVAGR